MPNRPVSSLEGDQSSGTGQLNIRLESDFYRLLRQIAAADGMSLPQFVGQEIIDLINSTGEEALLEIIEEVHSQGVCRLEEERTLGIAAVKRFFSAPDASPSRLK